MKKQEFYKAVEATMQKHGFKTCGYPGERSPSIVSEYITVRDDYVTLQGGEVVFHGRSTLMGEFAPAELRRYADEMNRLADLVDDLNRQRLVYEY